MPFLRANGNSADPIELQIQRYYTQKILDGELPAGTKLPSNQEIALAWSTSSTTVQRALTNLVSEGLIERRQRSGTFVRNKNHRALVGILFGPDLTEESSAVYRALHSCLKLEIDSDFLTSRVYDGLTVHRGGGKELRAKEHKKARANHLKIDRRYNVFTGFLQIAVANVPVAERTSDRPTVVFDPTLPNNDILLDFEHFGREMARALHRQEIRKLWVVRGLRKGLERVEIRSILQEAQALSIPEPTIVDVPLKRHGHFVEQEAYPFLKSYFSQHLGKRGRRLPEGIIFTDDNIARAAVFALLELGITIPQQIRIGILTSENVHIFLPVPVIRYYLPILQVAKTMVELLKKRIAGLPCATPVTLQGWLDE